MVSNQYTPVIGGIENLLRQLVPALVARGHEAAVLTGTHRTAQEPRTVVEGVAVFRNDLVRAVTRRDPLAVAAGRHAARAVVADFAPDVIHAHDCGPILWAVEGTGVPIVVTVHVSTDIFDPSQFGPVARQLARCDWVTGVSQSVVDETTRLVPELRERISLVTNGVAVTSEPPAADARRRRIIGAGRLVEQKGFDLLLRAVAEIIANGSTAELVIAGDGPLRRELDELAAGLGIARHVTMLGPVRHADMPDVLASGSVVAMPSRFEGMPLLALEAGLAARPVVATAVHGLADVVVDGETGLHVPAEDPSALAMALSALLDDPARADALGRAARAHVITRHSLDASAAAYEALYQRLVGR